eukprot:7113972-Prorocentrum_lima.AAC.1
MQTWTGCKPLLRDGATCWKLVVPAPSTPTHVGTAGLAQLKECMLMVIEGGVDQEWGGCGQ